MKKLVPKWILLFSLFLFPAIQLTAQCTAGWNTATINWDNLDYLTRNGTYSTFVTNAMRDTQYFALGVNRVKMQLFGIATNGENGTNTAEAGSYGAGDDVEYSGTGSIVLTFDAAVKNLQFSLYDIDNSQQVTVTAGELVIPESAAILRHPHSIQQNPVYADVMDYRWSGSHE